MTSSIFSLVENSSIEPAAKADSGGKAAPSGAEFAMVETSRRLLVVIDNRTLARECFAQGVIAHKIGMEVETFGSVEAWKAQHAGQIAVSAVIYSIGGRKTTDPAMSDEIQRRVATAAPTPVIVLGDVDDLAQTVKALEAGAKGYIPSSMGIYVCVEAIKFVLGGGVFVPASSVVGMFHMTESGVEAAHPLAGMFTARQAEVVEALRRGKANKIIAYELKLRESTVKVHIRNIMKKIKASNRTEVVYKINDLFPGGTRPSPGNISSWQREG